MVVFDLDDTLYLERQFVVSGFAAVENHLVAKGMACSGAADVFVGLLDTHGSGRVFDLGLEHFSVPPSAELVAELVSTYRHHAPTLSPQPGIKTLLTALGAAGVRLGVITDGDVTVQQGKLDALGLADCFEVIVATDALGPDRVGWKPSTRPFEFVEDASGLSSNALTYVGDNAVKDFVGASKRGWQCVRLRMDGQLRVSAETPPGVLEVLDISSLSSALLRVPAPSHRASGARA
jgi:putative hydrolase of the HAD superfamily